MRSMNLISLSTTHRIKIVTISLGKTRRREHSDDLKRKELPGNCDVPWNRQVIRQLLICLPSQISTHLPLRQGFLKAIMSVTDAIEVQVLRFKIFRPFDGACRTRVPIHDSDDWLVCSDDWLFLNCNPILVFVSVCSYLIVHWLAVLSGGTDFSDGSGSCSFVLEIMA